MQVKNQMDSNLNQVLVVSGIIATIIGSSVGILKFYYIIQDRKPKFTYERVDQNETGWLLMILHPDKPIHKISATLDGTQLRISALPEIRYERTMRVGEGMNFDVGKNINDESIIIIRYDRYKIKKRWRDIPLYR